MLAVTTYVQDQQGIFNDRHGLQKMRIEVILSTGEQIRESTGGIERGEGGGDENSIPSAKNASSLFSS